MAYTKQTWNDLPSTTSPYNATRMNHIEDGIYNANVSIGCATAYISDSTTSSSTASINQKITLTQINSNTDKLTLSNGGIKIGSGISKVLVSGTARYYALSNAALGDRRLMIIKNSTSISRVFETRDTTDVRFLSLAITPILIDVAENDIIYLYSNSPQPSEEISSSSNNETRLTIEVKG